MKMPASRTMPALLDELAERYPDRNFVTDGARRLSYAQFRHEARRLARGLHAIGVRPGDKVALLMGNQLEWLLVDFAVTMLGGVLVAVNTWWRRAELEHALALSDAAVLVMVDRYINNDYSAAIREIGALPCLRKIVCLGEDMPPGAMEFAQLWEAGADVAEWVIDAAAARVQPDDMVAMMFTSGSTARSKAACFAHRGLIENMHGIGERMHLTPDDRLLMTVSMFWAFACANALFAILTHGASIVMQFRFDAGEALGLIEAERCTLVYTQPNIVIALHAHPDRPRRNLRSWRTGICRPGVMNLLLEMGPQQMITSYGLTEGYGNSCNSDAAWPVEVRCLGSGTPLPGTEVQIVDPTTHAPVPAGEEGEIRLRGFVTMGYYKDPVRTAEAIDGEGWLYTGDIGRFEPTHGVLQFRGRFKEMIKTGGINVTPADVEAVLEAHPAVRQAVVVGVPDPTRDEAVAALVVLHDGESATIAELLAHCRNQVASYKVPRHLEIIAPEDMPLTETAKVSKRLAQARLAASYVPDR
jgi:fatty-acyl-CoA synthase